MNKTGIFIDGKNIYRDDNLILKTEYPVTQFLEIDDLLALLFDENFIKNENIFGYGLDGILKWQIEKTPKIHKENYFTSIYINENGELQGYNVNGVEVTIDKNNGSIIGSELIK